MKFVLMNVENRRFLKDKSWPVWMPNDRYTEDIENLDGALRWDTCFIPNRIKTASEIVISIEESK